MRDGKGFWVVFPSGFLAILAITFGLSRHPGLICSSYSLNFFVKLLSSDDKCSTRSVSCSITTAFL